MTPSHRRVAEAAESLNQVSAPPLCPLRLCGEPGLETLSNYASDPLIYFEGGLLGVVKIEHA
jgi:hypothetical protein